MNRKTGQMKRFFPLAAAGPPLRKKWITLNRQQLYFHLVILQQPLLPSTPFLVKKRKKDEIDFLPMQSRYHKLEGGHLERAPCSISDYGSPEMTKQACAFVSTRQKKTRQKKEEKKNEICFTVMNSSFNQHHVGTDHPRKLGQSTTRFSSHLHRDLVWRSTASAMFGNAQRDRRERALELAPKNTTTSTTQSESPSSFSQQQNI